MTADEAQAALDGWNGVSVAQHGPFWTVGGVDPQGVSRSGSRGDLASLVADLLAQTQPIIDSDGWPDGEQAGAWEAP